MRIFRTNDGFICKGNHVKESEGMDLVLEDVPQERALNLCAMFNDKNLVAFINGFPGADIAKAMDYEHTTASSRFKDSFITKAEKLTELLDALGYEVIIRAKE